MKTNPQSGNAVVWALIAIALFAALTAALMSSSRNSTAIMSNEEARSYAKQIIAYGNDYKTAVQRLKFRGCGETKITFETPDSPDDYTNTNAPTSKKCHIFDSNGGNLIYEPLPDAWLDGQGTGSFYGYPAFLMSCANGVGTDPGNCNTAADAADSGDLVLFVPWISASICEKINAQLYGDSTIPVDLSNAFWSSSLFKGRFNIGGAPINYSNTSYDGRVSGCFTGDGAGTAMPSGRYAYYQVLLAR